MSDLSTFTVPADFQIGAAGGSTPGGLGSFGSIISLAGMVTSAIGGFYSAKSAQYSAESQALDLEFRSSMANINARLAEQDASFLMEAGRRRRLLSTMRAGAVKGQQRASQGARGIQAGVGSAAESLASTEYAKELDAYTIDANTFREVSAARMRGVNFQNEALLTGVSAQNVRRTAASINPALDAFTQLIGGAGRFARNEFQRRRLDIAAGAS